MPRLFDVMSKRGIRASAFINALCADVYPALAKATVEAGWELIADEEAEITRCLARLEQLSGEKVRGWFGAGGGETMHLPTSSSAAASISRTTGCSTTCPAG
ncbi:MAG: hypothetical protein JO328_17440 [Hyphomicrobiales bacterium]|nr:hypothetical protein [Hyphomicrobiales bacterium]MBV8825427.1 hypothetical protein [Hyphomicrobiales bacterium]MBV9426516.1 hypothetical protein [Bradyrhizobiaceae bacterium]